MSNDAPGTALEAMRLARLPVSGWPWRSAWYLTATAPVAAFAFGVLGVPWLVLVVGLVGGTAGTADLVVSGVVGLVLLAGLGPLVGGPIGAAERRLLRIADRRPLPARAARVRMWARYADQGAWREAAYAFLLPLLGAATLGAAVFALIAVVFTASPVILALQEPEGEVALVFGTVVDVDETAPFAVAGVLMLVALPYLVTLLAGVRAALARALLASGSEAALAAELIEVSRSRTRLADAFESERRRIERDLHDGAQQRLVSLTLKLGLARLDLPPDSPAAASVGEAHDQAKHLMAELRELIHGIRPQILTDLGLGAALGELADAAAIPVDLDVRLEDRPSALVETTAYFTAAEALTNVIRHSGAEAAAISTRVEDGVLVLEVRDDGRGGADPAAGTGLTGLADRAAVAGGRMLLSSPAGGPTVLRVELPCEKP
ncbi:sensor histidine kinase [Glycomyces sp. MUSA5-2]|uniref:sensor histidine kinase n=1 Tax=Glycomyces sp. MUSA5-2 TaxID=2053002 RepID=UPI00300876F5